MSKLENYCSFVYEGVRNRQFHNFYTLIIFLLILSIFKTEGSNLNSNGWEALINNHPFEAMTIFKQNLSHSDGMISGEAYRGLAYTMKFLGHLDSTMIYLFKGFLEDKDTVLLYAAWINLISFGREWVGHSIKDGYRVLEILTQNYTLTNGECFSLLVDRYINDGNVKKARRLIEKMGIIRSFQMIGPFENISGSGYKKNYPPEKGIDLTKMYNGKDGAKVSWFPFYNRNHNGWVFTDFNYASQNAILYYYSNVQSTIDQEAIIGFGASGIFKIYLNDNLILADSVFHNTGTDMFMQAVNLHKGDNKLLIKIGHENIHSNFFVRFMDNRGQKLNTVSYNNSFSNNYTKDTSVYSDLTNSPLTKEIEKELIRRLDKNRKDPETSILLMDFYNATELTDKGQALARKFLTYYPESSLWYNFYSESLRRSKKFTEDQTALKTAFKLCTYNYKGWQNELESLSNNANSRDVIEFINKSHIEFQNSPHALLYKYSHFSQTENESEALKAVEKLESEYLHIEIIVNLIANLYIEHGNIKDAEKIMRRFLKWKRTSTEIYSSLADMYLKGGQKSKAIKIYLESIQNSPNSSGFFYYLAKLSLQYKDHKTALKFIDKAIAISPTSSPMISLKGTILNTMGKKDEAIKVLKESIRYTYNYFDAWDKLFHLEGKDGPTTFTKLPDPVTLRDKALEWKEIDNENGSILAFIKDIFFYPSRCSRERHFIMVYLSTQNAIDIWKEYVISYNSYYQLVNITKAYSINSGNKETPADVNKNMAVFKSLQPGDAIVLEWTIENHYQHDMARQIWGEHDFSMPFPVYKTELRFVTPINDTIPYTVIGDSISRVQSTIDDFRIITFSRGYYKNPSQESYALIDPPNSDKIFYSTFQNWSDIANWYSHITENKAKQTYELKELVDSLTREIDSEQEKVKKIHEYITSAIRYSYIPFRQSAWIPQSAGDVLAAKIGDCKDMSSLGKSLLDYAGIKSHLVLVNTRDRNSIFPTYIGPNFNHCILSYNINNKIQYIDLTDNTIALNKLPRIDQGALALVVSKDNNRLIHLPIDSSSKRTIFRRIYSKIDNNGTLTRLVKTVKTGVFASNMRTGYRYLSESEQKKMLKQILVESFPNASIDTMSLLNLKSLNDSLEYIYKFTAENAVKFSNNTSFLALNNPDMINGADYPSEENRSYVIDMTHTWFGIGNYEIRGKLTFPDTWQLINLPETDSLSIKGGRYFLSFKQKGSEIKYIRKASFNFKDPVSVSESIELRNYLSKITQADNIQLMFYVK